ncbi:hypothetical protein AAG906_013916 [Vitis piasezkii]
MGWRRGNSIKDSHTNSLYDARREARKAFLALSSDDVSTDLAVSEGVKSDLQNVIELPANDDLKSSESTPVYVLNPKQDLHGLGYDPFKHAPEFREKKRLRMSGKKELGLKNDLFAFKSRKVAPGFGIGALEELDVEDEDVYASGYDFEDNYVQEVEEPSGLVIESKQKLGSKEKGVLSGFKVASKLDYQLERFDPPVVPKNFVPHHKFPASLDDSNKHDGVVNYLRISPEKNQSNPLFSFLTGGNGCDYYARKLWEERQKHNDKSKLLDVKSSPTVQKMTAESGKILGERPLERSSRDANSSDSSADVIQLQFNLSDTFTKPASLKELSEIAKPFKEDPAKQERFELFLKEKYHGGLRSTDSGGASNMSEAARAREKLDFEAAAETIEKGLRGKESLSTKQFMEMSATAQAKVTQAEELVIKKMYPKREEFQWRPSPILCKRFDIIDPFMGKPPPAPRRRSKMDSLVFTSDSVKSTTVDETVTSKLPVAQLDPQQFSKDVNDREIEVNVEVEKVERPVDLYKAIFSDDQMMKPGGSPDMPQSINKARTSAPKKESNDVNPGNISSLAVENKPSSTYTAVKGTSVNQEAPHDKAYDQESTQEFDPKIMNLCLIAQVQRWIKRVGKPRHPLATAKIGDSSSEDERSRKRSRRRRQKSLSLKVKGRKKGSSREKSSSSRRYSKHHKRGSRDSPSRSSRHSSERERSESKREKDEGTKELCFFKTPILIIGKIHNKTSN